MPNFRIGLQYLTHNKTKYFRKGASSLSLGDIGEKDSLIGTVNPHKRLDVTGLSLMKITTLEYYFIQNAKGEGKIELKEMTESVKATLATSGKSSKVGKIIVEVLDFYNDDVLETINNYAKFLEKVKVVMN